MLLNKMGGYHMLRKEHPYNNQQFLIDINPLSKTIHNLGMEKKCCNIHKIILPNIKMFDSICEAN